VGWSASGFCSSSVRWLSRPLAASAPVTAQPGLVTELVNRGTVGQQASGGASHDPAVSRTGLIIAFASRAINLVSGDTNGDQDILVRYRGVPQTIRANVSSTGA